MKQHAVSLLAIHAVALHSSPKHPDLVRTRKELHGMFLAEHPHRSLHLVTMEKSRPLQDLEQRQP